MRNSNTRTILGWRSKGRPRRLHPLDRALTSSHPALHDEHAIVCRVGNDECRRRLADRPPNFGRGARTETAIFLGCPQQGQRFQSMGGSIESTRVMRRRWWCERES